MPNPQLSVVMPVLPDCAQHMAEAVESVMALDGLGVSWELLIQEDSVRAELDHKIPKHPSVRYGFNGMHAGAAATKTIGLSRASGLVVTTLAADDILIAPGTVEAVSLLLGDESLGWVVTPATDLFEDDGSTVLVPVPFAGRLEKMELPEAWDFRSAPPVHPASTIFKTRLLRSIGGWMALPGSEDTAALMTAAAVAPGWCTTESSFYLRKWRHGSRQRTPWFKGSAKWRFEVIRQRVDSLQPVGLSVLP